MCKLGFKVSFLKNYYCMCLSIMPAYSAISMSKDNAYS